MVEHIWQDLTESGHAGRIGGVLFFAYALVAEVPGVAVDSDGHGLHIADWDLAMTPYQEGSGAGAAPSPRRYWTLAAHPARYRVVDAVRDLDEDWWLTGGADVHTGDRVAIWKTRVSMIAAASSPSARCSRILSCVTCRTTIVRTGSTLTAQRLPCGSACAM